MASRPVTLVLPESLIARLDAECQRQTTAVAHASRSALVRELLLVALASPAARPAAR
jgi:hypothetical protein